MGAAVFQKPLAFDLANGARRLFAEIAARTADVEGVSRPAFSPVETETLQFLMDYARAEGLAAEWDAGRNVTFSLPEHARSKRYVLVGSHVDSVPRGGNFDGLAGVVSGLLCLVRARREGISFPEPVKVIAMRGEESAWFGPCYIGSKALLGVLSEEELVSRHKGDGRTLFEHMEAAGVDMTAVRAGRALLDREAITTYVEVHIEQGPVLIERNLPAAIVSGIRGNFRYKTISCLGEAGHSGAVPLAYRHDPVLAMAELLNVLDAAWNDLVAKGCDLVVTSGMVSTDQQKHALSRIPDSVHFSLDVRSQDRETLETMHALMLKHVARIEQERAVRFELGTPLRTEPALCDPSVINELLQAAEAVGVEPALLPSGGGHDAAVFAQAGVLAGMIFIRNRNGSHNPQEAMEIADFAIATTVLHQFLMNPAKRSGKINALRQTMKDPDTMFRSITDIIRQKGNAARAYRAAATAAQEAALRDNERASGYFLLATAAQEVADLHYGEPIHAAVFDQELARLEGYATMLDAAFDKSEPNERLAVLNQVAAALAAARASA
ncbi:hydantoinase/carbamoylase family amidase [Rhizobium sp. NTR19]|uniref:Hydantoinase/carbamoylase family amidase n=1 Tax=Neorhizobium turbinariae TaxID=2937795 RepID=A0ABT0IP03_9HYPH|nr:hydantoinase/carbamoylase family amidase [Neorhizobium turbinariae]MCK8779596.1 hydantoinase/carbamoylase family amidase [Neorhizobium turbinariae]